MSQIISDFSHQMQLISPRLFPNSFPFVFSGKMKPIWLCLIFAMVSSCSLKEDPEHELTHLLQITRDFRNDQLRAYPNWEVVDIPYRKVSGRQVPIPELRWWRGVERSFYFPKSGSDNNGFSLHLMLMYNRRQALRLFHSFCRDSMWVENGILSPGSPIFLYRNALVFINREPGCEPMRVNEAVEKLKTTLLQDASSRYGVTQENQGKRKD